jgi:hypothetical protein
MELLEQPGLQDQPGRPGRVPTPRPWH